MKIARITEKLKDEIHSKGLLPLEDIHEEYKSLKKTDLEKIKKALVADPAIIIEDEVFKLISIKSSTEAELLNQINLLEQTKLYPDKMKLTNLYHRGIIVIANPFIIVPDFLNKIYQSRNNLSTALHISPESTMNVVHHLMHELEGIEKEINKLAYVGKISGKEIAELEEKRKFLKNKIDKLTSEELIPFRMNITFSISEINEEELNFATSKILTFLRKLGFIAKTAINYQKDIFKTIVPSGANFLKRREIIVTNNLLSSMFPFVKR